MMLDSGIPFFFTIWYAWHASACVCVGFRVLGKRACERCGRDVWGGGETADEALAVLLDGAEEELLLHVAQLIDRY